MFVTVQVIETCRSIDRRVIALFDDYSNDLRYSMTSARLQQPRRAPPPATWPRRARGSARTTRVRGRMGEEAAVSGVCPGGCEVVCGRGSAFGVVVCNGVLLERHAIKTIVIMHGPGVLETQSPQNVLKYAYDHSCY